MLASVLDDVQKPTDAQLTDFVENHPGWTAESEVLSKTYRFDGFAAAVGFVAAVGVLAEKAFHHPDIDIRYTAVTISLTTHDAGGLTTKDLELAEAIERL